MSHEEDRSLVSLNLCLFGLIIFTGPVTPYVSVAVLGHGGKLGVIDMTSCKPARNSSETGRLVLLRLWIVLVGFELWVKPIA